MPGPLAPWTPFAEFSELRNQLDRGYQQLFDGEHRTWMPAIDVERNTNHRIVRADVPGVKPDDVKIEAQDGGLTISGKHEEHKDQTYLRRERRYGSFTRSMALPEGVDPLQDQSQDQRWRAAAVAATSSWAIRRLRAGSCRSSRHLAAICVRHQGGDHAG
jgi:HSP20 family protein